VKDRSFLEGVGRFTDGVKLEEYEFRKPEEALENQKNHANSDRFPTPPARSPNNHPGTCSQNSLQTRAGDRDLHHPLVPGGAGIKTLRSHSSPTSPATVEVAIAYPGASANVLVDSVLIPLEQAINGFPEHALHDLDAQCR